jgi:hypothetical protein
MFLVLFNFLFNGVLELEKNILLINSRVGVIFIPEN